MSPTDEVLADLRDYQNRRRDRFSLHRAIDRSLFVVIRDFGKLGFESVTNPDDTRESLIAEIASGQIDRVSCVIECNPAEGWSRDVTTDLMQDVAITVAVTDRMKRDGIGMLQAAE